MAVYLDLAILLNMVVDFLLLVGTNRLSGFPPGIKRAVPAAVLGGAYAGACLLPGFRFLGNLFWRLVFLALMSAAAFGYHKSGVRRGVLFILLSMALGGIASGIGQGSFWSLMGAAAALCLLCVLGFQGKAGGEQFVNVELRYGQKQTKLMGLKDTGNTLRDPVTGQQVLVAGAEVAEELTGLTKAQLRDPVRTVSAGTVPGLRLIPYRAVGQPGGMLLALRIPYVKVGSWQGSSLVAFAPDGLGKDGTYQILTGGIV